MAQRSQPSFERVFLAEYPAVLRHLTYLTGDRSTAEDLAQEAFRRLLEHDSDAEDLREPGAWLRTVASRLAYNHFRDESRRTQRDQRHVRLVGSAAESTAPDLEDVLDVRAALAELEPRDRAALMLRHSGCTYAEIADVLGMKTTSVGQTIARAQRRFVAVYTPSHDHDIASGVEGVTEHVSR